MRDLPGLWGRSALFISHALRVVVFKCLSVKRQETVMVPELRSC